MGWRVPVEVEQPVTVSISDGSTPYKVFRVYPADGSGRIGPVPQGKIWYLLSMSLGNTMAADIFYVQVFRVLAGIPHVLYGYYLTGTVYTIWSKGVDSHLTNDLTTLPLPDLILTENDFIQVDTGAGAWTELEIHVMEANLI